MATVETQNLILDVAVKLFNEKGVKGVSVNEVAEVAGVSRGNLHYHYRTKSELIRSIFLRFISELEKEGRTDAQIPTLDHMRIMFERHVKAVHEHRFFFRELAALTKGDADLARSYQTYRKRRYREVRRFFEAMIETGVMRKPESASTITSLITISWIVSDHWVGFLEAEGEHSNEYIFSGGFNLISDLFRPYLINDDDG